jgi:hypothetical protein
VFLVGCYGPTYQTGTPCETACPGDLVCVDRVCREPGDVPALDAAVLADTPTVDGPAGDVDGDGHGDGADNCPGLANADQHDEDGDLHGDVCDPCPHLAGTLADADGDTIGDACDPQPSVPKQVLRFFDPFTVDRDEWQPQSGATRVGETLRLSGSGFTELLIPTGGLRIEAAGTVETVSGTADHQFAIGFGVNANETRYHYCEFYDDPNNEGATLISEAIDGSFPSLAQTPYNGVLPLGAFAMRIDESVAAQRIVLQATVGGQVQPLLMASTANAPVLLSGSKLGFWVENIDARIHYVWVIETLP